MSLAIRGIDYDTGTNYAAGGGLSRPLWRRDLVTSEIRAIRHQAHANTIGLFGSRIDRIMEATDIALDHDLDVWWQPRLIDGDRQQTVEFLAEVAETAEALRSRAPTLVLNVGCEFTIFSTGIVPGATHLERAARLASPRSWPLVPHYNRRLNHVLAEAADVARSRFGGRITYGAGQWERVDWSPFDLVGLDYYRMRHNHAGYARRLRRFHRWGKPVVITEFGSGSYRGAAQKGPMSHDVIDISGPTPRLNGTYVRDEQVQAQQLCELLDIYEAEDVSGAFAFEFIDPYNPHSPDPNLDEHHPYHWEPKAAFHAIAARYRQLSPDTAGESSSR